MEIKDFARSFINVPSERTPERKALIKSEYYKLTGRHINTNCGTCWIEAIMTILRKMEKQKSKYILKKGCIIQPFGGGIITNDNLTDEIAEQALRDRTANPNMFAEMPEAVKDADLKIIDNFEDKESENENQDAPAKAKRGRKRKE